jgi:hypothetical protein
MTQLHRSLVLLARALLGMKSTPRVMFALKPTDADKTTRSRGTMTNSASLMGISMVVVPIVRHR